jgi:hypothetical protein
LFAENLNLTKFSLKDHFDSGLMRYLVAFGKLTGFDKREKTSFYQKQKKQQQQQQKSCIRRVFIGKRIKTQCGR